MKAAWEIITQQKKKKKKGKERKKGVDVVISDLPARCVMIK